MNSFFKFTSYYAFESKLFMTNIESKDELNFITDGIQIKYDFIGEEKIAALRNECAHLFSHNQIFGHGFATRLGKHL